MARESPLGVISKAVFVRPPGKRRGRKTTRIGSCLDSFLRSLASLEALMMPAAVQEPRGEVKPEQVVADPILSEFVTEDSIRRWADPGNYLAGLQCFGEGRLSHRTVSDNVLSAVVNARRKGKLHLLPSGMTEYSVSIKVERTAIKGERWEYRTDGHCDCPEASESEPCAHLVALLISWLRKPAAFQVAEVTNTGKNGSGGAKMDPRELARKNAELAQGACDVLIVLQELLVMMEDQKCSKNDTLRVLETVYSRVRLASTGVGERLAEISKTSGEDAVYRREAVLGFSVLLNAVSLRLSAAVETNWNVGATALLNGASADLIGGLLGALANMAGTRGAASSTISDDASRSEGRGLEAAQESAILPQSTEVPGITAAAKEPQGDGDRAVSRKVSRSWDGLVEELTRE